MRSPLTAAEWRTRLRERIDSYRRGDCDFETLRLSLTVLAALDHDGAARLRPAVREPLQRFLGGADAEPELAAIYAAVLDG